MITIQLFGNNISFGVITFLWVVTIIMSFTVIFLERKDPAATLAWLLVLLCVPVVGIFLYFLLSQNIARRKLYRIPDDEIREYSDDLRSQEKAIESGAYNLKTPGAKEWRDMISLNQRYGDALYTQDNRIFLYTDGHHMFDALLKDIKNAKKSINVMYFIVKSDFVGKQFIAALTEKAKEGLEVRLLIDDFGSRSVKSKDLAEYEKAGGKVAKFFPKRFNAFWFNINYRNHRKMMIIDGNIGHIGGYNIAREYLGLKPKMGYWRDTSVKIIGSAVQDLNARFMLDWQLAAKEELNIRNAYKIPQITNLGHSGIQIVTSGPNSDKQEIKRGYMKMITSARKNVYIQTPYFVPDQSILESLKMAALSGVDVRLMIPCKPDHFFIYWATWAFAGELIKDGVKVYIYDNGFLHAKTIVADSSVASIGSANFDRRSFKLNFEANAFIYDSEEAAKLESIFESDMVKCHELTEELYEKRSFIIKIKESCSRLLSDIL